MTYLPTHVVRVRMDSTHAPVAFQWAGRWHTVVCQANRWRVDVSWWGQHAQREYFKLVTDSGLLVVVYHDLHTHDWWLQRLYD